MSAAKFGEPFTTERDRRRRRCGDEVYVGLALCAHNPEVVERAVFRNVRVIRPAAEEGFRRIATTSAACSRCSTSPQRRAGSVHPRRIRREPFEAPNWTPDGGR